MTQRRIPQVWSNLFRTAYVEEIEVFGQCVLERFLAVFSKLSQEADRIEQVAYETQCGDDPWSAADDARDKAVDFMMTMRDMEQGALNLFGAGLYHLFEQQLLRFLRCGLPGLTAADLAEAKIHPNEPALKVSILKRLLTLFGIDLESLPTWSAIDQLRLFANAVKHADGESCEQLKQERPDLFVRSWDRAGGGEALLKNPVYQPLSGQGLYLDREQFREFVEAVKRLWTNLADAIEAATR